MFIDSQQIGHETEMQNIADLPRGKGFHGLDSQHHAGQGYSHRTRLSIYVISGIEFVLSPLSGSANIHPRREPSLGVE